MVLAYEDNAFREGPMTLDGRLLAWIEDKNDRKFTAYFVSSDLKESRPPATSSCVSRLEAQLWIESQAEALRLPLDWVSDPR